MDVFNFPNTQNNNFVFFANGGTTSWQTWTKPVNVKYVSIFAISGGGGGGGGRTSSTVINAAGGGGGASSGTALGVFPANSLPDTLYIQVGLGGIGGPGQASATSGGITYVSTQPNTTSINVIIAGSASVVAGGVGGHAGGGGGVAPSSFSKTSTGLLGACGTITATAGWGGAQGGTALSGTSIFVSGVTTGGAGGGGNTSASIDNIGGNITGIGIIPTILGGSTGLTGDNGYISMTPSINSSIGIPMFFTGGAGGGSRFNGVGGNGGNGGYGCGGGGAGSGLTGGTGGNGGNGLVIITCW
jgi:hypothetical protein